MICGKKSCPVKFNFQTMKSIFSGFTSACLTLSSSGHTVTTQSIHRPNIEHPAQDVLPKSKTRINRFELPARRRESGAAPDVWHFIPPSNRHADIIWSFPLFLLLSVISQMCFCSFCSCPLPPTQHLSSFTLPRPRSTESLCFICHCITSSKLLLSPPGKNCAMFAFLRFFLLVFCTCCSDP